MNVRELEDHVKNRLGYIVKDFEVIYNMVLIFDMKIEIIFIDFLIEPQEVYIKLFKNIRKVKVDNDGLLVTKPTKVSKRI